MIRLTEDDMITVQARGKSPIAAFDALYHHLIDAGGLYLTQISGKDWMVRLDVKPPTMESEIKWVKHIKELYKHETNR